MQISRNAPIAIVPPSGEMGSSSLVALAATELADHLRLIGMRPEIRDDAPPSFKKIYLGEGWSKEVDERALSLTCDGIAIHSISQDALVLSGGSARGVLNAVYVFLEDCIGIIWANPKETLLPKADHWSFEGLERYFSPTFTKRALSTASALSPQWAARRRLNFFTNYALASTPPLSGSYTFAGKHCHNVYKLLSLGYFGLEENPNEPYERRDLIERLFEKHPEYFGLLNGKRVAYPEGENADISSQKGNISLTNPTVLHLLAKGARLLLEHYPNASILSLSLRDNYDYCEEAVRYPGGVVKALLDLVNGFAALLEETHPHIGIDFLAYHGTQRPPEAGVFHPNVSVRYCPIRVSQFHAFDESEHNLEGGLNYETPPSLSQPVRQLKRWRAMTEEVVVWYYTLHLPYLHPHPSLRPHSRNFELLRDLGVRGVFIQDNSPMALNQFNDLRAHLLAKLLWNADIDYRKELESFCHRYYGAAASYLLQYIDLLHDEAVWDWEVWNGSDGKSHWGTDQREESWSWFGDSPRGAFPIPHFYILYHTRPPLKSLFFEKAWRCLRAAKRCVAESPVHCARLEEVQVSFYYGVLCHESPLPALQEEAAEWLPARFEALKHQYAGVEFHGLEELGLSTPRFYHSSLKKMAGAL